MSTNFRMVLFTKDNVEDQVEKVMASKYGRTGPNILVYGKIIKLMARANLFTLMVTSMKVTG